MNVLLVRPPEPSLSKYYGKAENLGLGLLAAILRKRGYSVTILDSVLEGFDAETVVARILADRPALLGFSVFSVSFYTTSDICRQLRRQGYEGHITLGGHFPTFRAHKILSEFPEFDSVVRFEGEIPIVALAEALSLQRPLAGVSNLVYRDNGEVLTNQVLPPPANLDDLPHAARDTLRESLSWNSQVFVSTSRGCWARCTYCSINPFYCQSGSAAWRARSAEDVVDEIEALCSEFGVSRFCFGDADFIGPGRKGKDRAVSIAEEIVRRGLNIQFSLYARGDGLNEKTLSALASAGLNRIYLGIESGAQSALDRWNKHASVDANRRAIELCRRLGLHVEAGLILYDPDTTLEEIRQSIEFMEETGTFDLPNLLARMEIRAGIDLEAKLEAEGRLSREDFTNPEYRISDPRVEVYWKNVTDLISPLVPVYFAIRDARVVAGYGDLSLALLHEKINRSALEFAKELLSNMVSQDGDLQNCDLGNRVQSTAASLEVLAGFLGSTTEMGADAPSQTSGSVA